MRTHDMTTREGVIKIDCRHTPCEGVITCICMTCVGAKNKKYPLGMV